MWKYNDSSFALVDSFASSAAAIPQGSVGACLCPRKQTTMQLLVSFSRSGVFFRKVAFMLRRNEVRTLASNRPGSPHKQNPTS